MGIRVASDTIRGRGIPYVDLFYEALNAYDVELISEEINPKRTWLLGLCPPLHVLHFQWPEDYWRVQLRKVRSTIPWFFSLPAAPFFLRTLLRFYRLLQFRRFLGFSRRCGVHIMWTIHNFEAHEGVDWIDRIGYRLLYKYSELIICHSHWAKGYCAATYRPLGRLIVMMHGNYDAVYPAARPRPEVLKELGLRDDLPVLCCVGALRGYRGLELACDAVGRSQGAWQLIVAGPSHPDFDMEGLARRVAAIPGAVLIHRRLLDSEFSDVVAAGDAVLLPYRKATTSGMIHASLTLGVGVVTSDLPYFREILGDHPEAGILVKTGDPGSLYEGIASYLAIPRGRRTAAARELANTFAWDRVILPVAKVISAWSPSTEPVDPSRNQPVGIPFPARKLEPGREPPRTSSS